MIKKLLWAILLIVDFASAQTLPQADALQRDIQKNFETLRLESLKDKIDDSTKLPKQEQPYRDENATDEGAKETEIILKSFLIDGNTRVTDEEIQLRLKSLINQKVSFKRLKESLSILQRIYSDKGYIAKVYFPEQKISDGNVKILIIEAKVGSISKKASSTSHISESRIQEYIASKVKEGDLLNTIELSNAINRLNEMDGFRGSSSLLKGSQENTIDVAIKADLKEKYNFFTSFDNYGTKYLGMAQNFTSIGMNDLLNYGFHDKLALSTMISRGNKMGSLYYRVPIGMNGLQASFKFSKLSYSLGEEFESLDIEGGSISKGVHVNYTIVSSDNGRLDVDFGYDELRTQSTAKEVETSNKTTKMASASLVFSNQDTFLSGGTNQVHMNYVHGNLTINNDVERLADSLSLNTMGFFSKIEFEYFRYQKIAQQIELSFGVHAQKAFNNLTSGEKIALGGPYSVRAYTSGEISGDEGYFYNADLKYFLTHHVTASIFYDYGCIKRDHEVWTNETTIVPQWVSLDGAGIGLHYDGDHGFGAKIEVAKRISVNEARDVNGNDSDGENHKYRIWLSARYNF